MDARLIIDTKPCVRLNTCEHNSIKVLSSNFVGKYDIIISDIYAGNSHFHGGKEEIMDYLSVLPGDLPEGLSEALDTLKW